MHKTGVKMHHVIISGVIFMECNTTLKDLDEWIDLATYSCTSTQESFSPGDYMEALPDDSDMISIISTISVRTDISESSVTSDTYSVSSIDSTISSNTTGFVSSPQVSPWLNRSVVKPQKIIYFDTWLNCTKEKPHILYHVIQRSHFNNGVERIPQKRHAADEFHSEIPKPVEAITMASTPTANRELNEIQNKETSTYSVATSKTNAVEDPVAKMTRESGDDDEVQEVANATERADSEAPSEPGAGKPSQASRHRLRTAFRSLRAPWRSRLPAPTRPSAAARALSMFLCHRNAYCEDNKLFHDKDT